MRFRNEWIDGTIVKVKDVANDVRQIQIMPKEDGQFTPGAHIDVTVMVNGQPEIRSYSLIGSWKVGEPYIISVKRLAQSKGGSKYMWTLEEGNRIQISKPSNHFELSHTAKNYLLIAGGIGITPLVGMAEVLSKKNGVKVDMLYLGKNRDDMPYLDLLEGYLGDQLTIHDSDEKGMYDLNNIFDYLTPTTQVYMCGPMGLMNAVRSLWESSDYNIANLRFETFGASGAFAPQKFTVKLPRFDLELEVPENKSILKVLEGANIEVMYDCLRGECGLCQVDIIEYEGDIDHRDFFFNEEEKGENKKMCACVSRVANGNIVIDTAYRG